MLEDYLLKITMVCGTVAVVAFTLMFVSLMAVEVKRLWS